MLSSPQCRAARALLDWSREQLAEASKVSLRTIVDFERGARQPREITLDALHSAMEKAGVIFVPENGEGAGVRLRKARPATSQAEQIANADDARSQAADAADSMMTELSGSAGEKAGRRGALTDEPAMVGKAKAKKRS